MSQGITVDRRFRIEKGARGRKVMSGGDGQPQNDAGKGSVPRISRLMALAIKFQKMIDDSEVESQAEIAELGFVSRARITQIMNLLHLAPDIQEEILFLPTIDSGWGPIRERRLRPIVKQMGWPEQRRAWERAGSSAGQ